MGDVKGGGLGSRVVSVQDSGAEGPGFKSQPRRCRVTNSLGQTVHTRHASVHQAAKLVAALLRAGGGVTAGQAKSNGSLTLLPNSVAAAILFYFIYIGFYYFLHLLCLFLCMCYSLCTLSTICSY